MALKAAYPWIRLPLIASAPMLGAATPELAVNVSRSGGIGFLAGGTDANKLDEMLEQTTALLKSSTEHSTTFSATPLPVGVGFQLFNSSLDTLANVIAKHTPAMVWLFAPKAKDELRSWSSTIRSLTNRKTHIWVQVGSIAEARESIALANPDVLVLQGNDAGGHGRSSSASIVSLVPEAADMLARARRSEIPILAAGGIVDGRGVAAALALGASGAVMGTRFLAAEESGIAMGWKRELLRVEDGGISTVRSTLCDRLKQTKGWPSIYDGRAIRNQGHVDEEAGISDAKNIELFQEESRQGDAAWGSHGRMVTYAGTGVGMIKETQSAGRIMEEVLRGTRQALEYPARTLAIDEFE